MVYSFTVTTICSSTAHNTSKWRKYHKCAWKKLQILISFILTIKIFNKTIFKTKLNGDKRDCQYMHIERLKFCSSSYMVIRGCLIAPPTETLVLSSQRVFPPTSCLFSRRDRTMFNLFARPFYIGQADIISKT